ADERHLLVNGDRICVRHIAELSELDWQALNIDIVLECSGQVTSRDDAEQHLRAGARRVLISNPADSAVDNTIIYGLNHHSLSAEQRIVSNGSRSEEHTSELQSRENLVCRLLLEKKKRIYNISVSKLYFTLNLTRC